MKTEPSIEATRLPGQLLTSAVVRARWGYKDRASFWSFVRSAGVPHIRLNARRIMFDENQLADWLAKRSSNTPAS